MDSIFETLLSWSFLFFCLLLATVVEVTRRFVEYFEKDMKDLKLWNNLILPVAPVFLGGIVAGLIKMYPYPAEIHSTTARIVFGLVAGLMSGFVYRALKAFINNFIKSKTDSVQLSDNQQSSEETKE